MKTKAAPTFTKESDLCDAFLQAVASDPLWTAYPETAGWDILLVRKDGIQIGVQAKLVVNAKAIAQALPDRFRPYVEVGPHYRAVLAPYGKCNAHFDTICGALGITVIEQSTAEQVRRGYYRHPFYPELPGWIQLGRERWHEWCPLRPCPLPDYVPDCGAGNPSPLALTPWKIAAIKLMIVLEDRPVTRADFKQLGLSPSRWTDPFTQWLTPTNLGYVRGPGLPDFGAQHPANYQQIKADKVKWMPSPPLIQRQGRLPLEPVAEAAQ